MNRLHTLTKMIIFFIDLVPKVSLTKKVTLRCATLLRSLFAYGLPGENESRKATSKGCRGVDEAGHAAATGGNVYSIGLRTVALILFKVAQQKKVEKKQKELAELQKLSPESQRRKEEKLRKRELKKMHSKAVKIVKA